VHYPCVSHGKVLSLAVDRRESSGAKGRKDEGGGRRVEQPEWRKGGGAERERTPRASSGWLPSSALCGKWPLNNA